MTRILLPALLAALVTVSALASDGVLVPIFYGDSGAYGSLWRTRLTIFNNSDFSLPGFLVFYACGIPEGCQAPMPARTSVALIATDGFRYNNGFLVYTGLEHAEVSYSLRVYDESRSGVNYGTDVPVVPLDSFTETRMQLLDVTLDPAFRVTLRVYAIPPAIPRVRVSVYRDQVLTSGSQPAPPSLLKEQFYDLTLSPFPPLTGSYSRPSAIVVGDLLDGTGPSASGPVRIEVQSATAGAPIWAFASVTNNATQTVTVVVPHPTP